HALELHAAPVVRVAAAVRLHRHPVLLVIPLEPWRLLATRLVIVEDAFLDDEERLGLNAVIVPSDRAAAAFLRSVALNVHDLGTVLERAEDFLRRRHEARSRVNGLVSHRSVTPGRMTEGFVNRE